MERPRRCWPHTVKIAQDEKRGLFLRSSGFVIRLLQVIPEHGLGNTIVIHSSLLLRGSLFSEAKYCFNQSLLFSTRVNPNDSVTITGNTIFHVGLPYYLIYFNSESDYFFKILDFK